MKTRAIVVLALLGVCACTSKTDRILEEFDGVFISAEGKSELVSHYSKFKEEWEAALEFIHRSDLDTLSAGRYELTEKGTYANVQDYRTRLDGKFEYHKKYIDLQYIVRGGEVCELTPLDNLAEETKPYSGKGDAGLYRTVADSAAVVSGELHPGSAGIYFPCDGHKPNMSTDGQVRESRKIVVKIPVIPE